MMQHAARAAENPSYKWIVMGIVMIGTMMATLDSSIVNVSIPAIMADFGANIDEIEWVLTGYMIAFATLMPLTAWLGTAWDTRPSLSGAFSSLPRDRCSAALPGTPSPSSPRG